MSIFRQALLIALLLSQAVFTAAGSTLVVCMESGNQAQFELLSGACCDVKDLGASVEADPTGAQVAARAAQLGDPLECGSCQDQTLWVASLERHDCRVPRAQPAPGVWNVLELGGDDVQRLRTGDWRLGLGQRARELGSGCGLLGRGLLAGTVLRC